MARRTNRKLAKRTVKKTAKTESTYLDKIEKEIQSNQSRLSMVLGILIVLVVGVLIFNYFQKGKAPNLGPASQTANQQQADVSPQNLPGKYTVKEGDTLFTIAQKYYQSGDKYTEIAKANNISDVNSIEKGQVLEIPKPVAEVAQTSVSPSPSISPSPSASPEVTGTPEAIAPQTSPEALGSTGTGGADTTIWGPKIEGNTYTVVEGDWLSKIAGRAYGDITAYEKIAKANNIQNPDLIYPGQVLVIPR